MGINKDALPVEAEELESIRIRANGLVFESFSNFKEKISQHIDISMDAILEVLGVKYGKYKKTEIKRAQDYFNLNEDDKLISPHTEEDIKKFEEINEYQDQLRLKVIQAPMSIINTMIKGNIVDGEPVGIFDDFLDLLSLATGLDKSRLFMSDYSIWVESFVRIFLKNQGEMGKSFFTQKAIQGLKNYFQSFMYTIKKNQNIMRMESLS